MFCLSCRFRIIRRLCASPQAAWNIVGGQVLVRESQLTTLDLGPLVERHDRLARMLVERAGAQG